MPSKYKALNDASRLAYAGLNVISTSVKNTPFYYNDKLYKQYGVIIEFNKKSCLGKILLKNNKKIEFCSTCYSSGRPVKFPCINDNVMVLFNENHKIVKVRKIK